MNFIIDIDGTLMNSMGANLDSIEFINTLKKSGYNFVVSTNSIKSPRAISQRLIDAGIDIKENQIITPICAINTFITANSYQKALIVGSQLEIDQIEIQQENQHPDVIVFLDFEKENYSFSNLQMIYSHMQKGISAITASNSLFYFRNGNKTLDTGSFVKLFENATNRQVINLGKPSLEFFQNCLMKLQSQPSDVIVIGDDWSTDILGAFECGCMSLLLKSGKYQQGDESNCKPTRTISKLMEVFNV
ncbi:MAG: HAD-IIA family hydrolase [Fibrobacteres bacterium]|nr:HAD-IIA family hydrolase [Fibrobacterota bacterium]